MWYNYNPVGIPKGKEETAYFATFVDAIRNVLIRALQTERVEHTQLFAELTDETILKALQVQLYRKYGEQSGSKMALARSIAHNFTVDALTQCGIWARKNARKIFQRYREEKIEAWNALFRRARYQFDTLYPEYRAYAPTQAQKKQIDAVKLLMFEGRSTDEVVSILQATRPQLWQWKKRGVDRILADPDTTEEIAFILKALTRTGDVRETWPPIPDDQFLDELV